MKNNNILWSFLAKCLSMYLLWFLLYELWMKPSGNIDFFLTSLVTRASVFFLDFIDPHFSYGVLFGKHFISLNEVKVLRIADPCNGMVLYPLFWGFIIATPGVWKNRLIMGVLGSIFIFFLNVFRVIILICIKIKAPEYLDFNHKYTFTVLVYAAIFGLWMIWINWSAGKKVKTIF